MLFAFAVVGTVIGESVISNEHCIGLQSLHIDHAPSVPIQTAFVPYNWNIHNNFSDIDAVVHQNVFELAKYDNMVTLLGRVVIKHGLQSVVGVANVHKHFDVADGEELVYQINPNFGEGNDNVLYFGEPVDEQKQKELNCEKIPYVFKLLNFDDAANEYIWTPVQFLCVQNNQELVTDISLFMHSNIFSEFLNEVSSVLIDNGGVQTAGIQWRFDRYFEFKKPFQNIVEATFSNRTQIFQAMDTNYGNNAFPTGYIFEYDDSIMDGLPILDECGVIVQACDHCIYVSGHGHIYR